MSPPTERLAVYLWLSLIDQRLPAYVARVFAHDLQSKTLKDIQPLTVHWLFTGRNFDLRGYPNTLHPLFLQTPNNFWLLKSNVPSQQIKSPKKLNSTDKICSICKAAGRKYRGYDVSGCWFLLKVERLEIPKTLQVNVEYPDEEDLLDESQIYCTPDDSCQINSVTSLSAKRVECDTSPFFHAFYQHHPRHVLIDSGATFSIISRSFLQLAGITLQSTLHSARSADISNLNVEGEVHIA